ncbi:unnamed protein product, partial [Scytosiphon promiscuus]
EPRLESSPGVGSAQPVAFQTEASLPPGVRGMTSLHGVHSSDPTNRGGGGSNMVSRDDTAAMHRLIAQWLTREVGRLARRAADIMPPVERGKVVRALLHSLGVLAVFFSHACETGVDHAELESALWVSVTAAVKALEYTAKAVDYHALCEGLARLHRVVRSLLDRAACSVGHSKQPEGQDMGEDSASASALAEVLRFCSKMVKDWHKGTLRNEPPAATNTARLGRSSHSPRTGGSGGGGRGSPSRGSDGG